LKTRSRNSKIENRKDISYNLKVNTLEYKLIPNKLKYIVYTLIIGKIQFERMF
jgi:hypothetical protein